MATNNAINTPQIVLGGTFTMSGAFTFTGTLTGNTSVTFPTSGTLATTTQIPSLPLSLANGGTNANLTADNGGIVYSTGSALAILAHTTTANQVLLSGNATTPSWSTATYPATTTINQLLYSSAANTITGLATANSSVLVTSAGGVPSLSTTLPSGLSATNMSLTTPTLITPIINTQINDTNNNPILHFTPTASSVNYINMRNNSTGLGPIIGTAGSDPNIPLFLTATGTAGVNVQGITDASNATSGYVGEVISSVIASGSAVSFSSGVPKDLTSINLPAGDWDLWGNMNASFSGSNGSAMAVWSSTTSATAPDRSLFNTLNYTSGIAVQLGQNIPIARYNVTTLTTVYISGTINFTSGTCTVAGGIYARRRR